MRTFEDYEKLAAESKKIMFKIHISLQIFESENKEYRTMENGGNFYMWKSERVLEITKESSHRSAFLESWMKGNFSDCDYHANRFIKI